MKRTLLATCATLSLGLAASSAMAGNLAAPIITPAPAPVMVAPVYAGNDWSGFYMGGSLGYASVDDNLGAFSDSFDGATYGLHAGYDYDFGSFVMGAEIEISGFDLSDTNTNTTIDSVSRFKVRAGYDAGNFLPYLTAGVAKLSTSGAPLGDVDDSAGFYGLGLDYKMTDRIRVGGEVLKHEFNDYADSGLDVDATTAALRVSFEF